MNPLSNLVGLKFKNLNASQLMQVVFAYAKGNNYLVSYGHEFETVKEVTEYFERSFGDISNLKRYFKDWTE